MKYFVHELKRFSKLGVLPVLGLIIGVSGAVQAAKPGSSPVKISMASKNWRILYSNGMPRMPTASSSTSWFFDFPEFPNGHIHYLLQNVSGYISGTKLVSDIIINTTGSPVFEYKTEANNTCIYPAHVRFHIEKEFTNADYVRWWASARAIQLAPGVFRYEAPLDPAEWSETWGRSGNSSPEATAGFYDSLANPSRIGFTFGGGCFFGHGVGVTGGTARFQVNSFSIQ